MAFNFWDSAFWQNQIDSHDKNRLDSDTAKLFGWIDCDVRNHYQSKCEVFDFQHNPPALGDSYCAYLFTKENMVGTWMSDPLMTVTRWGKTWTRWSTYGFRLTLGNVWAVDAHGFMYRGIWSSDRDLIRMKRIK